jgi:hypothetical protein
VRRRLEVALVELARHRGVQRVVDQRALARARDAGDAGEQADRDLHVHRAQVVAARADDAQHGRVGAGGRRAPLARHLDAQRVRQVAPGQRFGVGRHLVGRALRDDAPAVHAGAQPHVHHVVGGADHVLVVLDHQHRVAEVAQVVQRADQALVVALVQPDAGLVEHVHHARQAAADLAGQPDALRLAARQRVGAAVQAQVGEADVVEELQPRADLAHHLVGDLGLVALQAHLLEEGQRIGQRACSTSKIAGPRSLPSGAGRKTWRASRRSRLPWHCAQGRAAW